MDRQISRSQFYRDLKIAAKLWHFDPEAVKNRAFSYISEQMRISKTCYEQARQASTEAQRELDAATTRAKCLIMFDYV